MDDETPRLYGPPGAESLHVDLWEAAEDVAAHIDPGREFVIEEWTTHPPAYHLPSPDRIAEWIIESADEVDSDWGEAVEHDPDVIRAAQELLDVIELKVTYRMAADHVATHRFRATADDYCEPLEGPGAGS